MEPGDLEEGMKAAQAIGDDTLQKAAGRRPVPESFTHGTSEQRMTWLRKGLDSGDPAQCDTFKGMCGRRSEEHTSALQSLMRISSAVFCLNKITNLRQNDTKHNLVIR